MIYLKVVGVVVLYFKMNASLLNLHCLSTVKVFKTLVNCAGLILLIDQILCNNVVDKFGTCEFILNSA